MSHSPAVPTGEFLAEIEPLDGLDAPAWNSPITPLDWFSAGVSGVLGAVAVVVLT